MNVVPAEEHVRDSYRESGRTRPRTQCTSYVSWAYAATRRIMTRTCTLPWSQWYKAGGSTVGRFCEGSVTNEYPVASAATWQLTIAGIWMKNRDREQREGIPCQGANETPRGSWPRQAASAKKRTSFWPQIYLTFITPSSRNEKEIRYSEEYIYIYIYIDELF
jgi:hypothetical protein